MLYPVEETHMGAGRPGEYRKHGFPLVGSNVSGLALFQHALKAPSRDCAEVRSPGSAVRIESNSTEIWAATSKNDAPPILHLRAVMGAV
jgi:hypothetical protein